VLRCLAYFYTLLRSVIVSVPPSPATPAPLQIPETISEFSSCSVPLTSPSVLRRFFFSKIAGFFLLVFRCACHRFFLVGREHFPPFRPFFLFDTSLIFLRRLVYRNRKYAPYPLEHRVLVVVNVFCAPLNEPPLGGVCLQCGLGRVEQKSSVLGPGQRRL